MRIFLKNLFLLSLGLVSFSDCHFFMPFQIFINSYRFVL